MLLFALCIFVLRCSSICTSSITKVRDLRVRTGVDVSAYMSKKLPARFETWPAGLSTLCLLTAAGACGGHGISTLLSRSLTQGLEVDGEGALHQKHQR